MLPASQPGPAANNERVDPSAPPPWCDSPGLMMFYYNHLITMLPTSPQTFTSIGFILVGTIVLVVL